MKIVNSLRSFLVETNAATAVEYAVMLALILLTAVAGLLAAGGGVSGWWTDIDTELGTHGF